MKSDESGSVSEAQISVKMPAALKDRIQALCSATEITPGALLRRLAEMAADYFEDSGEFSFPGMILAKRKAFEPGEN